MNPLYKGKAKRMWVTKDPETLRMEFKDDATAFDGEKKADFESKDRFRRDLGNVMEAYGEV
ncbi:MAG: phosphoribosylaminoimidazolesuccinocarboxamide synthase, partial [Luteolibacter sp.]